MKAQNKITVVRDPQGRFFKTGVLKQKVDTLEERTFKIAEPDIYGHYANYSSMDSQALFNAAVRGAEIKREDIKREDINSLSLLEKHNEGLLVFLRTRSEPNTLEVYRVKANQEPSLEAKFTLSLATFLGQTQLQLNGAVQNPNINTTGLTSLTEDKVRETLISFIKERIKQVSGKEVVEEAQITRLPQF